MMAEETFEDRELAYRDDPGPLQTRSSYSRSVKRDADVRAMTAGLIQRLGLSPIDANAADRVQLEQERAAEEGLHFREYTLKELCRESLRLAGRLESCSEEEMIRAAVSTGGMANVFTGAVNAALMKSFGEALDTTEGWVREVDIKDFKPAERVRLGKVAGMGKLARGGEAQHAAIGDVKETYTIARYARQFAIDEMDIVDDNLDALITIPMEMGAAARRLRPNLVYAILLANGSLSDGVALFHADHNNLLASNPLAAGALEAGIAAMSKQTEDGANIDVRASFLIVPQDLRFTAATLLHSAERIISADSGGTLNPLLSENIAIRSDNRIGVAGVTDPATGTSYTGTAVNWFLAASPTQAPTIEVGYLASTGRRPIIREYALTEGRWGIGWDVKMDIGAKALDFRGLFKAVGS